MIGGPCLRLVERRSWRPHGSPSWRPAARGHRRRGRAHACPAATSPVLAPRTRVGQRGKGPGVSLVRARCDGATCQIVVTCTTAGCLLAHWSEDIRWSGRRDVVISFSFSEDIRWCLFPDTQSATTFDQKHFIFSSKTKQNLDSVTRLIVSC